MQPSASDPARPAVTSRDVAKGVGTTMLARLGSVIDVLAQPLYVFLFGLPAFGLYTVLWASVNLAENVADLGMTSALQRTVPQARDDHEAAVSLAVAILWGVLPCIVIALVASLAAPSIANWFNVAPADQPKLIPAIRLFAWALPLWAYVEIATSALRAQRLFGPEIRLRVFWEQLFRLILATIFWALGCGITGLLIAHILSLSIICLLATRLLARHYRIGALRAGISGRMVGETTKAGLSVLPTNIVAQIFTDGPPVVLNMLLPGTQGATAAGLFGIARKIASIVQLFRTAFAYVLAPLASAATRSSKAEVQTLFAFTTRLTAALVVPLALVMAAGGTAILRLFGPGAALAAGPLAIMVFARMLEAMSGPAKPVQQVVSGYGQQLPASIIGLILAILAGVALVPIRPLTGMAFAVSLGIVFAAMLPIWQLHRNDALHPFEAPFGTVIGLSALVGIVGAIVAGAIVWLLPDWAELPLLLPLLIGTLWVALRSALPIHDREMLGKLGRRLRLV